jgi:hypothetical protein
VLPVRLRERIGALRSVTVALGPHQVPPVDLDVLVPVAVACRRPERLRFSYRAGDGTAPERHVEPYRLVYTDRRWYLVAFDRDRDAWRTLARPHERAARDRGPVRRTDPPDAAALVAHGVAWPSTPCRLGSASTSRPRTRPADRTDRRRHRARRGLIDLLALLARDDGPAMLSSPALTATSTAGGEEVRIEVRRLAGRLAQDHA